MIIPPEKVNLAEKDLEDYFYEHPEAIRFYLSGNEPDITEWIGRQYKVPSGIIDLLGVNRYGGCAVVELKNVPLESKHLAQVCRYASDIEYVCDHHRIGKCVWRVLIGKKWNDEHFLEEAEALGVYVMTFDITMNVKVNNGWRYSDEVRTKKREVLESVMADPIFSRLAILNQAEEIIQSSGDEESGEEG